MNLVQGNLSNIFVLKVSLDYIAAFYLASHKKFNFIAAIFFE